MVRPICLLRQLSRPRARKCPVQADVTVPRLLALEMGGGLVDARWRRRASLGRVAVALLYFALLSAVRCAFVRARRARDRGSGVGMGGPGGTGMPLGRL